MAVQYTLWAPMLQMLVAVADLAGLAWDLIVTQDLAEIQAVTIMVVQVVQALHQVFLAHQ